jgi:ribosomal protein L31E
MEKLDKLLESARTESEDSSFAFVAQTLANHYRADSIRVRTSESEKISKRGSVYVTALKAESAWIATQSEQSKS